MKKVELMPGLFMVEQTLKKSSNLILPGQVNAAEQQKASYSLEKEVIIDFRDDEGKVKGEYLNGTPILHKWAIEKGADFSILVEGKPGDDKIVQRLVFNIGCLIAVTFDEK